eukprot:8639910-Alexandrium_andersonii.AAC.1
MRRPRKEPPAFALQVRELRMDSGAPQRRHGGSSCGTDAGHRTSLVPAKQSGTTNADTVRVLAVVH